MKRFLSQENIDSVNRVISRSNFKDITPDSLLAAFQEEGIHSLEDFAKQLTEALKGSKGLPQKLNYETIFSKQTPRELVETIVHKVPQIPFRVDGVLYDPEDIVRFNGKELCFIGNNRSRDPELLVIEDKSVWASFLRMTMLTRQVSSDPKVKDVEGPRFKVDTIEPATGGFGGAVIVVGHGQQPYVGPQLGLCDDIDQNGSVLWVDSGESYRDLSSVGWWVFATDWNDTISSTTNATSMCLAFEHVDFQGSTLWLGPAMPYPNLTLVGWNDRISSVINSG